MKIRDLLKKMDLFGNQELVVFIEDNLGGVDMVEFSAKEISFPKVYSKDLARYEDIMRRTVHRCSIVNNALHITVKSKLIA